MLQTFAGSQENPKEGQAILIGAAAVCWSGEASAEGLIFGPAFRAAGWHRKPASRRTTGPTAPRLGLPEERMFAKGARSLSCNESQLGQFSVRLPETERTFPGQLARRAAALLSAAKGSRSSGFLPQLLRVSPQSLRRGCRLQARITQPDSCSYVPSQ